MIKQYGKKGVSLSLLLIRALVNFICPNLFVLRRVKFSNIPSFNQRTLITGKGLVQFGSNCVLGFKLGGFYRRGSIELQARLEDAVISFGSNVATNNNIFICAARSIEIGSLTLIGQNVTIMDFEAHGIMPKDRRQIGEIGKVKIGTNVWVGNNVIILKNTEVGDNCIIAAGAVVSGKFPSDVIIGGVPAKIIKELDVSEH